MLGFLWEVTIKFFNVVLFVSALGCIINVLLNSGEDEEDK